MREDVLKDPETRLTIRTEISEDEASSQPSTDSLDDIFGAVPEPIWDPSPATSIFASEADHRFRIHPMVRSKYRTARARSMVWIFSRLSCSGLEVREDHVPDDGGGSCNSDQVIAQEPRHR